MFWREATCWDKRQTLCGEEDFLPLYHNQGKECQKAFGSQQITFSV